MTEDGPTTPSDLEATLAALGGKYAARILTAAEEPKSAQELSDSLDVPIATCYRRIEELEDADLLACEGRKTSDRGRRTKIYTRTIDGAFLDVAGADPRLELESRAEQRDPTR